MGTNFVRFPYQIFGILNKSLVELLSIFNNDLHLSPHYAMKTTLRTLALAFIVSSAIPAFSQIAVGAKGGINFNSFRKSETFRNHFDAIPGFNLGAYGKYPVLPFLTARAEVLYFQQGGNLYDYRMAAELYHSDAKIKFHNVEIPLLAELSLPSLSEDPLQPKLLLGGFYSYSIYTRESYTSIITVSGYPTLTGDGYRNSQSQYYRSQAGLIAGLAAEMKVFNYPVSLEFRYQYNLNTQNKPGTQYDYDLKNTTGRWGNDLKLHTLSINIGVTLFYF